MEEKKNIPKEQKQKQPPEQKQKQPPKKDDGPVIQNKQADPEKLRKRESAKMEFNSTSERSTSGIEIKKSIPSPDGGISKVGSGVNVGDALRDNGSSSSGIPSGSRPGTTAGSMATSPSVPPPPPTPPRTDPPFNDPFSAEERRRQALERLARENRKAMSSNAYQLDLEAKERDLKERQEFVKRQEGSLDFDANYEKSFSSGADLSQGTSVSSEGIEIHDKPQYEYRTDRGTPEFKNSSPGGGFGEFDSGGGGSTGPSNSGGPRNYGGPSNPSDPSGPSGPSGPNGPGPGGGGSGPGNNFTNLRNKQAGFAVGTFQGTNRTQINMAIQSAKKSGGGSKSVSDYLARELIWSTLASGNEVGQGVRFARDNALPVAIVAKNMVMKNVSRGVMANLGTDAKFVSAYNQLALNYQNVKFNGNNALQIATAQEVLSIHETKKIREDLVRLLKHEGVGDFADNAMAFTNQCDSVLKIYRKKESNLVKELNSLRAQLAAATGTQVLLLQTRINQAQAELDKTQRVANILTVGKQVGNAESMHNKAFHKKSQLLGFLRRKLYKYGRQDMTINAMLMTTTVLRNAKATVRNVVKVSLKTGSMAITSAKIYYKVAKSAANAVLKTQLGQAIAKRQAAQALAAKTRSAKNLAKGATTKLGNAKNAVGRYRPKNIFNRFKRNLLDKFKQTKLGKAFSSGKALFGKIKALPFKGKYNPLRIATKALAKPLNILRAFLRIISAALNKVKAYLIAIAALFILVPFVINFFFSVFGVFDLENQGATSVAVLFDTIAECWDEEMGYISSASIGGYTNVDIQWSEDGDSPEERHMTNPHYSEEMGYRESSNFTELICMTYVHSDFDLDDPTKLEEGKKYLKGMYYGSHQFSMQNSDNDEEGDFKNGILKVDTIYFDELFDVQPAEGFNGISNPMFDGTGQFIKLKIKAKPSGTVKCSAFANYGDDGNPEGTNKNSIEWFTVAWLKTGMWFHEKYNTGRGSTSEHKGYVVLDIPENRADQTSGNIIFRMGDTGGGGEGCVFDVFFEQADTYRKLGWGHTNSMSYIPDKNGKEVIEAWIKDVPEADLDPLPDWVISVETPSVANASGTCASYLQKLAEWDNLYKEHHNNISRSSGCTKKYTTAKRSLQNGGDIVTNCCAPISWSLQEIGVLKPGEIVAGKNHKISGHVNELKRYMDILSGDNCPAKGMTVKEAVDSGRLQPGDLIVLATDFPHITTYSGQGYKMYDGGGASKPYDKGILADYSKKYKGKKIATIGRWKQQTSQTQ